MKIIQGIGTLSQSEGDVYHKSKVKLKVSGTEVTEALQNLILPAILCHLIVFLP